MVLSVCSSCSSKGFWWVTYPNVVEFFFYHVLLFLRDFGVVQTLVFERDAPFTFYILLCHIGASWTKVSGMTLAWQDFITYWASSPAEDSHKR